MARFPRTDPPPQSRGSYSVYRPLVRSDFNQRCAYCLLHEFWAGGADNYEIDHFHPVRHFPELQNTFSNLYYSCHICNQMKHDHWPSPELAARNIGFVDYCRDDFEQHFEALPSGAWQPRTESARYTELLLRLNNPHLVELRAFLADHKLSLSRSPRNLE